MVNYRREYIPESTVFLTISLKNRQSDWLVNYIDDLRIAVATAKKCIRFEIVAICVLPDHIHMMMKLPSHDGNFSQRVRLIKSTFSQQLSQKLSLTPNARGEYAIWQRRFWEHTIRDEADLQRCVDYVHFNPVKHGLVTQVKDWPFSSFHQYVRDDRLDVDWGCAMGMNADSNWGE
jgi:putative transposase